MLTIFTGKSCSGKDYNAKKMVSDTCLWLPECTTRPRRGNEVDGVDKLFLTDEVFNERIANGTIIEARPYNAIWDNKPVVWQYGTPSFDRDKDYVYSVDILGVFNIAKLSEDILPKDLLNIIYLDVSDEIRDQRARNRASFYEPEWLRRKADDNIKYSENHIELLEGLLGRKITRIEEN